MNVKKNRPHVGSVKGGRKDKGKSNFTTPRNLFQLDTSKENKNLVLLPAWLFDDLCKLQASLGVPLRSLIQTALEDLILKYWDFETETYKGSQYNGNIIS